MVTADVAGSVPSGEAMVEQGWRATCARASLVLGLVAMVAVSLILVSDLTSWLGLPWLDINLVILGALAGVVTGFLGRRSRRRWSMAIGSLLSLGALLGVAWVVFEVPYEPGISGLAWSPDGTQIAYAHTWSAADGADGVWLVAADGSSGPAHLVAQGYAPDWSPDGTTIAYGATPNAYSDLWLIAADGSNARKLSAADQDDGFSAWFDTGHSWSPDGSQIVFAGDPSGEGSEAIWIIGADGTNLRRVSAVGFAPDWSPDGARIAYYVWPEGARRELWVINIDSTGGTKISGDVGPGAPQWTTDGRIAVNCDQGLCVMAADGSNRQVLTGSRGNPLAYESGRILSPDGTRVAYVTGAGIKSDIVVTTIDGSSQITLIR